MASLRRRPGLELDVKVMRVASVEARLKGGNLFVRYYVPIGDGKRRIRVDTREVQCVGDGDAFWGELARFELAGDGAAAMPGKVAFELWWKPRPASGGLAALVGKRRPSLARVLARAELAVAAGSESGTWLRLSLASRELDGGCKVPKLLVEVHFTVMAADHAEAKKGSKFGGSNECCSADEHCGHCGWVGSEEDMFLAATFTQ